MKLLLYAAIIGFTFWMTSEIFEIVLGGRSPEGYYLTAAYHFFAALGIWGLHKRQTAEKNLFNTISAVIVSVTYLCITILPVQVLNSGLSFPEFINANPIYKLAGFIWVIGMILFSIAIIRTGFFPKSAGFIMLVGTIIFTAGPLLSWPMLIVNVSNIIFSATVIYISIIGLRKDH